MDEISRVYLIYGMSIVVLAMFLIVFILLWQNSREMTTSYVEYQPVSRYDPLEEIAEEYSAPLVKPRPRKRKPSTVFAASMEGVANTV